MRPREKGIGIIFKKGDGWSGGKDLGMIFFATINIAVYTPFNDYNVILLSASI